MKPRDGRKHRGRQRGCYRCGEPTTHSVSVRLTTLGANHQHSDYRKVEQAGRSMCEACAVPLFDRIVREVEIARPRE